MNSGAVAHKHGCQLTALRWDFSHDHLEALKSVPHSHLGAVRLATPQSVSALVLGGQHLLFHLFCGHGAPEDSVYSKAGPTTQLMGY